MRQEVLRPVDVAVALQLARGPDQGYEELADTLGVSVSTAHQAVQRLMAAGLASEGRRVHRKALLEFLTHGIRYAFFAEPGSEVRGVPTAHSAPPLAEEITSDRDFVWPSAEGDARGAAVSPLYDKAAGLPRRAPDLYEALALVDAIRVGRARERKLAVKRLERWLENSREES